jgi:5-(carboxyamino)imidazole ribonucleotide synthase
MTHEFAVTGNVLAGEKTDMYRPYLHLMARNPDLKFHQYKNEFRSGVTTGHITAMGTQLPQLVEDVKHAREYMSGVIDE